MSDAVTSESDIQYNQAHKGKLVNVDKNNFLDYNQTHGSATYDSATGIVTLTPDQNNLAGSVTLKDKIDPNHDFSLTTWTNLGDKNTQNWGGDGIGFAFHTFPLDAVGGAGNNLGIGGLANAVGFKLDTFHNPRAKMSDKPGGDSYPADPKNSGTGSYGAMVYTDYNTELSSDGTTKQWNLEVLENINSFTNGTDPATTQNAEVLPDTVTDGKFHKFIINYKAATHQLVVTYYPDSDMDTDTLGDAYVWNWTIPDDQYQEMVAAAVAERDSATNKGKYTADSLPISMAIFASTGWAKNLQQVKITDFDYTSWETTGSAVLKYVDSTTGKTIARDSVQGDPGAAINSGTNNVRYTNTLNYFKNHGYQLVPTQTLTTADKDAGYVLMQGTTASDRIFDDTDSVQEYVVYLEHTYSTATEDKTITETVKYQKTNGEEIAPSETKSVTVTHSGIKDNVTGQVNWTEDDKGGTDTWTLKDGDSATIPGVTSPTIDHYVADKTTINPVTVDVAKITTDANGQITVPLSGDPNASTVTFTNDGGNQTQELTQVVTYTELGTFSVQYVDQDNGNQVIPDTGYTSAVTKYGDQITYSTADTIADMEKKGYVLVNNEFDQTGQAFGDSSNGHTYTVTLKHGQVPVTPENPGDPGQPINPDDPDGPKWPAGTAKSDLTKDATQTIHYQDAGDKTPADNVTTKADAFTKTVTVDKVTGEIVSQTDFTGDPYTFGTVDTPVVDGYHTEKPTAGGLTATVDNPNPTDTVTYIANGQLIPVDQDGNPIPGTPTTTYTTDPKDPTKVVTEIPDVPGYTPTINGQPVTPGSYTPTDPSGDTTVVYVKNTSVMVEYFDQTTGKVLKTDTLTGLMGGDLNYTTTSTIQGYVAKGYRLVSDQFTDAGTTFTKSNDGKTYVITLAHTTQTQFTRLTTRQTATSFRLTNKATRFQVPQRQPTRLTKPTQLR